MARTDVLTTAKRIRRQLRSQHRLDQLQLFASVTSVASQLQFSTSLPNNVRAGTVLGIDLELMRVLSVDTANNQVYVIRGYLDSTAATHDAGALIDINPRFSLLDIVDAMIGELASWTPELYQVASDTFSVDLAAQTLEMPAEWATMIGVCEVLQSETGTEVTVWPRIGSKFIRGDAATFTGATTSGHLLRFTEAIRTGGIYVTVALPFDPELITDSADLVDDVGLTGSLLDVLELGVRRRVLMDAENNRASRQAQDEVRRAEEVPMGATIQAQQLVTAIYLRRRGEEARRLKRAYPIRMQ